MKSEYDDTTSDPDNVRMKTSCGVTQPVSEDQTLVWWEADFEEGEVEVVEVEILGEHYKVMWDRAFYGTQIFIGDQLCGTVDGKTVTEPFEGTAGFGTWRPEGNNFRVICE